MPGCRMVKVVNDEADLIQELGLLIQQVSSEALKDRQVCTVGLSGGSLIKFLCKCLPNVKTDWSQWRFFFCDERLVPFDDPDSTFGCYRKDLLPHIPISQDQFVIIDPTLNALDAAKDYKAKVQQHFQTGAYPVFDLLLLGMGPDGHTCSLFPGHPLLKEDNFWIAPITDSPKPPPERVTMTLPVVNSARCAVFAVSGASKADIVQRVLEDQGSDPLPAALVQPHRGTVHWILDKDAASKLKNN